MSESKYAVNIDKGEVCPTEAEIFQYMADSDEKLYLDRRGYNYDYLKAHEADLANLVWEGHDELRSSFVGGFRAILRFIFEEFDLPREGGVDFASGPDGFMVEEVLAPLIEKDTWLQSDISTKAVERNRELHSDSDIVVGSFMSPAEIIKDGKPLEKDSVPIATVMNGFHLTVQPEVAIEKISEVLRVRGCLLHIYDLMPSKAIMSKFERGQYHSRRTLSRLQSGSGMIPLYFEAEQDAFKDVRDIFRQDMASVIGGMPNMKLLLNDWMIAERPLEHGEEPLLYERGAVTGNSVPMRSTILLATLARRVA